MDDSVGLILKAIRFSAEKHNDQRRKDARSSPYINHPVEVAETLWTVGGVRDEALLVAAILHDTIEDTKTTPEEISAEFGEDVLALVLEVTDDKSLPKQTRKQLQVEHAPHKSDRAKLLKIADKINNVRDMIQSPPADWSLERKQEYLLWSEKVVAGLRGVNPKLESQYDDLLLEGKRSLGMG
ncbi:MAG: phosphohydrolase [Anaerolineales bacterium]|nr:bifunctional (p)ppGpp synthetase/guanosine-3',5'-bis(diphosphate) 3'-pyrophosphohydrolase [Anaerolineae bacterium]PWB69443.1 MAG: phosphohydrolase [Anaerolineales bacterium]